MTVTAIPARERDDVWTGRLRRLVLALLALLLLLAITGLIGAGIWLLVRNASVLGRTYPLSVRFADARGVEPGDAVEMAGVRIGAVERVSVEGANARVALRIRDDARIPQNSRFIALPDLFSTPGGIRIVPATAGETTIPPSAGDLTGESGEDLTGAFRRLNALTDEWRGAGRQTTRLLSEASRTTRELRAVVRDDQARRELRRTLVAVRVTAENGARAAEQLSGLLRETDRLARAGGPQVAAILADARKTTAATSRIAARGSDVLLSPAAAKKAAGMAADVSATLGSLRSLTAKTDALAGDAQKLAHNPALAEDLRRTLQNVRALSEKAEAIAGGTQAIAADPAVARDLKQVLHNLNALTETSNRLLGLLAEAAAKK